MTGRSEWIPSASLEQVLRLLGAALVLAAGGIHLWLYFDFFHRVHVIGVLFLLNAAFALISGLVLLVSGQPRALLVGIAYSAGTLAGFLVSVHPGLFGYVESLRGPWQEAAASLEVAALVVLTSLLIRALMAGVARSAFGQTTDAPAP